MGHNTVFSWCHPKQCDRWSVSKSLSASTVIPMGGRLGHSGSINFVGTFNSTLFKRHVDRVGE